MQATESQASTIADSGGEEQEVLQTLQERTVVPLEALEMAAAYNEALVELPSYVSDGVQACIRESTRSVKFVRNSSNLITEKLKIASRTVGRGGEHALEDGNEFAHPWRRPKHKASQVQTIHQASCLRQYSPLAIGFSHA